MGDLNQRLAAALLVLGWLLVLAWVWRVQRRTWTDRNGN